MRGSSRSSWATRSWRSSAPRARTRTIPSAACAAHLDLGDEGRAEEFMQKAQAVCERAGLEPDALVVLPFLD